MAVGLVMQFEGLNVDRYDALMDELGLSANGGDWPDGLDRHAAGATPSGWCVIDVWKLEEQFNAFLHDRLEPAFDATGGQQEPQVIPIAIHLLHAHGRVLARR